MAKYTKETDVLWQYSQGFRLIVPNAYKTCHTQFYSVDYPNGLAIAPSSYIVEGGKTYCPVPNQMTVNPNSIIVFAYLLEESRAITESKTVLEVWERPKPPDFIFEPSDTITYATAAEMLEQMKGSLKAEEARVEAESLRVTAESSRVAAEESRETAESARESAEKTRQANESARVLAESSRAIAESSRVSAEASRVSAEALREAKWNNASATAVTGDVNADVVITDSGVVFNFAIPRGLKGDKGDPGDKGNPGNTGNGIASMTLVSGNHAAGTVDTYRLTFTDGTYQDFTVYNGANGEGAGDMLWEEFNNRFNPSGKNGQIALESELTAHTGNSTIHVTSKEKTKWTNKYDKPSGGIPKSDLASSVQTSLGKADTALQQHQDISGKADVSALTTHTGDTTIHTSTDEKNTWNAKYTKPSTGIPETDLASSVQTSLGKADTALQEHQDISGKANVPTFSQYTILTSGWSSGVYSFESDFPNATYDIEIELDSTATESQVEAWSSAKVTAVFGTNTMKALGDVPTVDIPVIVKKVIK